MNKFKLIFGGLAAMAFFACSSKQIGLKENWIDERDMMALAENASVSQWMEKVGRPTLVEIVGDTMVYYYNYKPTMYAATVYDSTTFFKTWGTTTETKPGSANATEIWGSRRNIVQMRVVNDRIITAFVAEGPDKRVFVRDLNGNIVLDPNTGFNPNISTEQRIGKNSKEFEKAYNSIRGQNTWPATQKVGEIPAGAIVKSAVEAVAEPATEAVAEAAATEQPATEPATEAAATEQPATEAVAVEQPATEAVAEAAVEQPAAEAVAEAAVEQPAAEPAAEAATTPATP
ncbi:MAG: hypothetical protein LBU89_04915 [Fibromonadaceae bacterium]|jgi:hypothetical protein|nr:hypothetical protein [Fibromonadaceae bacterium]